MDYIVVCKHGNVVTSSSERNADSSGANKRRFADITNLEINEIIKKRDAVNIRKSTEQAIRFFTKYLRNTDMSFSLETADPWELDSILCKFYAQQGLRIGHYTRNNHCKHFIMDYVDILPIFEK